MRYLDQRKFDPEATQMVIILPQQVHESTPHDQAFREQVIPQASIPHEGDVDKKLKRLYISQNDIVTFGHTPGCPRCERSMEYGAGRRPHNSPPLRSLQIAHRRGIAGK